jgi:hypothetical protein
MQPLCVSPPNTYTPLTLLPPPSPPKTTSADHFQRDHYLCPHPACLEKKFVVFTSEQELKTHTARWVGGGRGYPFCIICSYVCGGLWVWVCLLTHTHK